MVDLPGYGFAFAKEDKRLAWNQLTQEFLVSRFRRFRAVSCSQLFRLLSAVAYSERSHSFIACACCVCSADQSPVQLEVHLPTAGLSAWNQGDETAHALSAVASIMHVSITRRMMTRLSVRAIE